MATTTGQPKATLASGSDLLSEAIANYKTSLGSIKLKGKITENKEKTWFTPTYTNGRSPIAIEFNTADVVDIEHSEEQGTATIQIKDNADYVITVAGVIGYEDDLPSGLQGLFGKGLGGWVA